MTKSQFLRCVAFLLIAATMMFLLCPLFEQDHGGYTDRCFHTYRKLEKDTIDAVFIGTSGVSYYWISSLAYEEQGITVYPLASAAMPSWLYTSVIEEALTYQDPELILLDIRPFTAFDYGFEGLDARSRVLLDSMGMFSLNRVKAAFKNMKAIHLTYEDAPRWDISYLLNFVKYHSRWSEDTYRFSYNLDMSNHEGPLGGFFLDLTTSACVTELTPHRYDDTLLGELDPVNEAMLYEVLEYIREKDLNVLFVDTPKQLDEATMARTNQVYRILEEEGFDYLTFLTTAEDGSFTIDLDYKTDFLNGHHVNYYGAEKFTRAFAVYLDERYNLPDRRNDPAAKVYWEGQYDLILSYMELAEAFSTGQSISADLPAEN